MAGYRDQVDERLDALTAQLTAREAELGERDRKLDALREELVQLRVERAAREARDRAGGGSARPFGVVVLVALSLGTTWAYSRAKLAGDRALEDLTATRKELGTLNALVERERAEDVELRTQVGGLLGAPGGAPALTPGQPGPFDRYAAAQALLNASEQARRCVAGSANRANVQVKVTINPDGHMKADLLPTGGGKALAAADAACIVGCFASARVQPFVGSPVLVSKTVSFESRW